MHAVATGVEGSSEDILFEHGITAHHHSWAGQSEPDLEMVPDNETYEPDIGDFDLPYGDWFDDVPNYEGTVDKRDHWGITIEVGAGEDGMYFDPPAVLVDPDTYIEFEWTGNGGSHNVVEEDGTWESDLVDEAGYTFPVNWETLDSDTRLSEHGVYRYTCEPHDSAGMRGAITVGDIDDVVDDVITYEVEDVELAEESIEPGESVQVTAHVDLPVEGAVESMEIGILVDGELVESVELPPAATTETFDIPFDETGEYDIRVNDEPAGTVTVGSPVSGEDGNDASESKASNDGSQDDSDGSGNSGEDDTEGDDDEGTSEEMPGFGVLTAVASLGGAAYLIKRRVTGGTDDEL
ncbi:halocyanin domain-containing protein [Natrarchaeobius chitinivorans]|uniref:Halocyanin domain-containing protein n=1 Tax=Natrarchaeobius chitinivorans TaxID=1679083 RepID=A0A3N6LL33_NATCH|nr:halocyanin domain-containing protein [Natrarchaeobius chitinivorans]RQG89623.1 halocyanin domain-containing protein [Natrarchaeobius chitinivorans]